MVYTPQVWSPTWVRLPTEESDRMNRIEAGVVFASSAMNNVRTYGAAPAAAAATNTDAIQAALDAVGAVGGVVFIPAGTYAVNELTVPDRTVVAGAGRDRTILSYAGTGAAVSNSTPGTRRYDWCIRDLAITTSTGAVGLDLDSISVSRFDNLKLSGFSDAGVSIHSTVHGGAVYNRFFNVTAQNCATGHKLRADSSNANIWYGCRANICSVWGWDLQDCNDNTLDTCQCESSANAIRVDSAFLGGSRWHRIRNCRIEQCGSGITIGSANVEDTVIDGLWWDGSTPNIITDNGTRTHRANDIWTANTASSLVQLPAGWQVVSGSSVNLGSSSATFAAATGVPVYLRGSAPNTSAAVGAWLGNANTLSTAGARVAGFCKDTPVTHAQPVAYIGIDGSYEFANGVKVMSGTGSPEGVVAAPVGSEWLRSDGGANTTRYLKESGTGNTGWVAK